MADKAMRKLHRSLRKRKHDGVRVVAVFHYGSVDIDQRHLVVWILLGGRPDDEIPEWFRVWPTLIEPLRPVHVDFGWLLDLRSEVQNTFRKTGWADPESVTVMVDSAQRVEAGGGWNYFR
jgi:hypothetical protein